MPQLSVSRGFKGLLALWAGLLLSAAINLQSCASDDDDDDETSDSPGETINANSLEILNGSTGVSS